MRTPIAITASKGVEAAFGFGIEATSDKFVDEPDNKSVAVIVVFVCTRDAEIILRVGR